MVPAATEKILIAAPTVEHWERGWLQGIGHVLSPNHDARPPDGAPSLIVLHAISLPPDRFGSDDILRLFTNTLDPTAHPYFAGIHQLRVSSHFLIRRDGQMVQFVSCDDRAWHAGVSQWGGRERCNDFSIGIELEGCDTQPFAAPQYAALNVLLQAIANHYPVREIAGHCHVAPLRKTDPGPLFDWPAVAAAHPRLLFPWRES